MALSRSNGCIVVCDLKAKIDGDASARMFRRTGGTRFFLEAETENPPKKAGFLYYRMSSGGGLRPLVPWLTD